MMKYLIFPFLLFLVLVSACSEKKSVNYETNQYQFTIDSLKQQLAKAKPDNVQKAEQEIKVEYSPYKPKRQFKSLAQMFASVITEGSSILEVKKIQGEPDLILPENEKTTYFYGNSEVIFKHGLVYMIEDADGIIKYAGPVMQLGISPDPIESRFAGFLINRRINILTNENGQR